ncbi:S-layer protein, partial [Candidatus Magnetomorum sp. HK-1]
NWIEAFINEFKDYIGMGNLIEETLITNEMMFASLHDKGIKLNVDPKTINEWNKIHSTQTIEYEGYTQTKIQNTPTYQKRDEYLSFRNAQFGELLKNLRKWTVEALDVSKIPVSWKFADIAYKAALTDYEERIKLCGLTKVVLAEILTNSEFVGLDIYEGRKETCSDLNDNILFYSDYLNYKGNIYITEFNAQETLFKRSELINCITGAYCNNIKYITIFKWSDNGESGVNFGIDNKQDQIEALSSIFSDSHDGTFPNNIFPDVKQCTPFSFAINRLKEMDVIKGHDDGYFRPDNPVNRAEFSKMLVKTIESVNPQYFTTSMDGDYKEDDSLCYREKYSDMKDTYNEWYDEFLFKLSCKILNSSSSRIINGYDDKTFRPSNTIIMAEMLKMIVQTFFPIDPTYNNKKNEEWYDPFVRSLKENEIRIEPIFQNGEWENINNYTNEDLKKEVTRKEAAKALFDAYLYYKSNEKNNGGYRERMP